ncbi:hypothetical protein DUNSADRAFT_6983 [Dunaliella salina]|uniref:Smr domain-containing protein n=1 Tax=Dunaliella salina TaxID=3046 RepID=A0ABQ7GM64_DUNSA|nr:hypothetical protein DUNSADRAFT_6983 [Dunaliella salina]|eukprot:KAF5835704.1 hypothetical protein DUNSADRAFT_6983 [Dunaliella salina]
MTHEDGGWQPVLVRSNGLKERTGASAKDAADKERSRLQSGKARQIAHIYFNFRNVFFQQANAAYNAGDGKAAAEFSRRGRQYGELAKQFRQASNEEAYKASNLGIRNTFVMDLHGMHVTEAMALLERQMDALGRLVSPEGVLLKCITGWGAHSARGIALIKPAVLDWAKQKGCKHFVEPGNDGVVIVHVTPNDGPHHR